MQAEWKWDRLEPLERQVAELLTQGKRNAAICADVFLSRPRVQECIKRILIRTETESTRAAIVLLVEERESMALLRVLDQATDGVAIVQDRVIAFANRALHQIHGYDSYEMHGIPMAETVAPRSLDFAVAQREARLNGEPFLQSYVIRIACKSGRKKDVLVAGGELLRFKGKPANLAIINERP